MLNSASMQTRIESLLKSKSSNVADYCKELATIYDDYARTATVLATPPGASVPGIFTGSEKPKLVAAFLAAHQFPTLPSALASGLVSGIVAYLSVPMIVFTAPPILGATTPPTGAPVAISALTSLFSCPHSSESVVASGMALAFDALTRSTIVVFTAPVPPVGPLPVPGPLM